MAGFLLVAEIRKMAGEFGCAEFPPIGGGRWPAMPVGSSLALAFVCLYGWRRRLHVRAVAPASCPRAGSRCAAFVWLWVALFLRAPGYGDHSRARRSVKLPPPTAAR